MTVRGLVGALLLGAFVAGCAPRATVIPPTVAERSGYTATATHAEVLAFLDAARRMAPRGTPARLRLHTTTFGVTHEGRAMPLAVWGADGASASAVRAAGTTRVLLIGGIHGGEVAGKEALLALVREFGAALNTYLADSLTVLVVPMYNADGGDRIAPGNRPLQLGPDDGMGTRANAQGLDLNRDFARLAAPESRALVALLRDYDPHLVVDFHTTDGTPMAYALTYAPGLAPDTHHGIQDFLWHEMLPAITDTLAQRDGLLTWHYGNVPGAFGEPATAPRGWYSFSPTIRFGTNYAGLRGRASILAEAYSYAPYETRVLASWRFADEVLTQAWRHARRIRTLAETADRSQVAGNRVTLRATWAALDAPHPVLLRGVDTLAHPTTGEPRLRWSGPVQPEAMPAFVRFTPTETARAPRTYYVHVGPHQMAVAQLLDDHGIAYTRGFVWGQARERFVLDSVRVADQPFQGARRQEVWGRWQAVPGETGDPPRLGAALIVSTDQPLGRLAAALLEPRAEDGVVAWGLVDVSMLRAGEALPIERLP